MITPLQRKRTHRDRSLAAQKLVIAAFNRLSIGDEIATQQPLPGGILTRLDNAYYEWRSADGDIYHVEGKTVSAVKREITRLLVDGDDIDLTGVCQRCGAKMAFRTGMRRATTCAPCRGTIGTGK